MRVVIVPCLADNYAYLVIDDASRTAAVVDPGEAAPVARAAAAEGVRLTAVWATHHHGDHIGGVAALRAADPTIDVVAHVHDRERIAGGGAIRVVADGDQVSLGAITASIIYNPGHTLGAISYSISERAGEPGAVFTGDTLFGAGCGRLFEGTAAQMHASLTRLAGLPATTRTYVGHEYTVANLAFAAAIEPTNPDIAARLAEAQEHRIRGLATTPSTIGLERATNPFLRVTEPAVVATVLARDPDVDAAQPVAMFASLRRWKDSFRV